MNKLRVLCETWKREAVDNREDVYDDGDLRRCAEELSAILPEVERLVEAASALLAKRAVTEMTYEEAYYFVFKNYGREYWSNLRDALALFDQPVVPKETK